MDFDVDFQGIAIEVRAHDVVVCIFANREVKIDFGPPVPLKFKFTLYSK